MSTPCKTLNLWGNITRHQHIPTNSRGFVPTKSWWTKGGASHILTMIRLVVQDQEKKMQWLKLVPSHIQIEIVDSKGIGHCCKKQDFIVLIPIDLISSWKVTNIEVIRRKCSANVYLSKFTLNKNLKFKDFIDVIFTFPRVLKFWFYLLKMYIVYINSLFIYTFPLRACLIDCNKCCNVIVIPMV